MLFRIIGILVTSVIIMYLIRKLVESIINLSILLRKENHFDVTKQRKGIVLNKRTKKLEADNSLILPF